jgi:hypothetical protein
LAAAGCPDGLTNKDDDDDDGVGLALTLTGKYSVAHPDGGGAATNYILLEVVEGAYTDGTYTLNGAAVTPTPVLTSGGAVSLVKIETPAGTAGTAYTLGVTKDNKSVLSPSPITFDAAGSAAPDVFYGETPMKFSEYFHDITANVSAVRPASKTFAGGGQAAAPANFITAGTRTGNSSAGVAGGTPKWTDTDAGAKVDVISSATYGDNPHFVPTGNLTINYEDPMTKAEGNEVTGIKTVEVGVDFELFANADLLRQADKAVPASTAVLAKAAAITWKEAATVYKAKYLQSDAAWGRRDEAALNDVAGSWPKAIGGITPTVSYGGTWADKVISVDFGPLTAPLDSAGLWNTYFEQLYAGYVEDAAGHKEPLVWLQNLFSHRGHTNVEAALQRAGISRMDKLASSGKFKVAIFAKGLEDIIVSADVAAYADSAATIEQGAAFHVSGAGSAADFKDSSGNTVPEKKLHVVGLTTAALADFQSNGGKLLKGTAEVDTANYTLAMEGEGEIEITLKDSFFEGAFQGAYSLTINSDTVYKAVPFTVNRIIDRPGLKKGTDAAVPADTAADAITVTADAADTLAFDNADFAKAVLVSGRTASSIAVETGAAETVAIGTVLKQTAGEYVIDPSGLTAGKTYRLSVQVSNFVKADRTNIAPVVYYITVE